MVTYRIDVEVSSQKAERTLRRISDGFAKTNKSAGSFARIAKRAFAVLAPIALAKQVITLADSFQTLQNRLRIVTEGQENLADVTNRLFDVATDSRAAFEGTAVLYARIALATREAGVSQEELLRFTESVNKAIKVSGTTAAEASAGIIQFSQGLASGALRGDELRSVLEQLPFVADVIAKSLGVTRGQLRELGEQGKLTRDLIFKAFSEGAEDIDEAFGKTLPTVTDGLTEAGNKALELAGKLDQVGGVTKTVSFGITGLNLVLQGFIDTVDELTAVGAIIQGFEKEGGTAFLELGKQAAVLEAEIATLSEQFDSGVTSVRIWGDQFEDVGVVLFDKRKELRALNAEIERNRQEARDAAAAALAQAEAAREAAKAAAALRKAFEEGGSAPIAFFGLEQVIGQARSAGFAVKEAFVQQVQVFDVVNQAVGRFIEKIEEADETVQEFRPTVTTLGEGFTAAFQNVANEANNLSAVAQQGFGTLVNFGSNALLDLARTGGEAFKDLAIDALAQLQQIVVRLLFIQALNAFLPGATGGGGLLGGVLGGARQHGGSVRPGVPFLVGEQGPELFTPSQSGTVSSNAQTAAAANQSQAMNVKVVVVADMKAAAREALSEPDAGPVIIEQISNNRSGAQQAIQ